MTPSPIRFWLSFVDRSKPTGDRSLGCCIVRAKSFAEAIDVAWVLGINPSGEVGHTPVDEECAARLSFSLDDYEGRLIPEGEAKALADRIAMELRA